MSKKTFTKQSEVFLDSEGDAYFDRNDEAHRARKFPGDDRQALAIESLINEIRSQFDKDCPQSLSLPSELLEIGCGDGARLHWIEKEFGLHCAGIDPSSKAIQKAMSLGLDARVGTAEKLPFEDSRFDIVLFGHCLYLCDPFDLFTIARETDRVLKASGWVVISDFFSEKFEKVPYHHHEGLFSHKMDYRKLFDWHPYYSCVSHKVGKMKDFSFSDLKPELVAVSIIRKHMI